MLHSISPTEVNIRQVDIMLWYNLEKNVHDSLNYWKVV